MITGIGTNAAVDVNVKPQAKFGRGRASNSHIWVPIPELLFPEPRRRPAIDAPA
jgi:hypothetical protein